MRRHDADLRDGLERAQVPGAEAAEARARAVAAQAFAQRTPARASRPVRRIAAAAAGVTAALAIGLSPAGAAVGELVSSVGEAMGIGADDAKPQLRSLPAAGELLVDSGDAIWLVREDGSKRRLGDYEQASWSPRGLFVAAAREDELLALEPDGTVRWTVAAPGRVRDPRWSPSGYRIAYRAGGDLWAVAGDGTGARLVARDVSGAPTWMPLSADAKLAAAPGGRGTHVLSYVDKRGEVRTIDADTGEGVGANHADAAMLPQPSTHGSKTRALSPDGSSLASLRSSGRRVELVVSRPADERPKVLLSARGRLTGPTWSPDARRLLVGWPAADQWLFIDARRPGRVLAIDDITRQFGDESFPSPSGWVLPDS